MKKWAVILILSCVALISICNYHLKYSIEPDTGQKFRIYQSFIHSYGDSDATELFVIICDDTAETNDLFCDVEKFHNHMNGTPKSLTIHLYKNKRDLDAGNEIGYKLINYD
jgi:hypothetical protein